MRARPLPLTGPAALWQDGRVRGVLLQCMAMLALALGVGWLALNTVKNIRERGLAFGFDFLGREAGFDIGFRLIEYGQASTYGRALLVGLVNTLAVTAATILVATPAGIAVGVLRLSRNGAIAGAAATFVEVMRNVPLLIHILFWHGAMLAMLPAPRQSWRFADLIFLNSRGLYVPRLSATSEFETFAVVTAMATAATVWLLRILSRQRRGRGAWDARIALAVGACVLTPAATWLLLGPPIAIETPEMGRFSMQGGFALVPEFVALSLGLSVYTSAFIAELTRAGILAVPPGQVEAGRALGLREFAIFRLIVLPQALRVVVPPLANQYQSVARNSSLAAAIAFPDFFNVFAGTVLNQTGQAIEVMFITLSVYMVINLMIGAAANLYNRSITGAKLLSSAGHGRARPARPHLPLSARLRLRLFGSVENGVLTLLVAALVLYFGVPFVRWAIVDATWVGQSKAACNAGGACWAFVSARWRQFLFGFYPDTETWRIGIVFGLFVMLCVWLTASRLPRKGMALALFLSAFPLTSFVLLRGGVLGLPPVRTDAWGGLTLTLIVGFCGIVASIPLGTLLALGRRSTLPVLRLLCTGFIELFRGVPLLAVLFLATIMLPLFLPSGTAVDKLLRALIGIALFASALMAEVIRGGLQAIPDGQYEGARALGLSYWKQMAFVVLPQALRISIPGIVNTCVGLFKDTTLVLIVGLFDLLAIVKAGFADPAWLGITTEGYMFVALIYWIICYSMSRYSKSLERA